MPIEAAVGLGAFASASNALVTLCKHGLHFKEIPAEVEQLRHAIRNLESSIQICKRIRRQKSRYLDQVTKTDVDDTVKRSEDVMENICRTIEGCRADIDTKGTVSVKNRLDWMFRGHEQFMSQGLTLNSSVSLLAVHISRMDNVRISSSPSLDTVLLSPEQNLRAPSVRTGRRRIPRLSSRSSFSNMSTFSFESQPQSPPEEVDTDKSFLPTKPDDCGNEKEMTFTTTYLPKWGSFTDEKEVAVSRSTSYETASIYSHDSSISASMTLIPELGCTGDYCTNDLCPNHNRSMPTSQKEVDYSGDRLRPGSRSSVSTFPYSLSKADGSVVGSTSALNSVNPSPPGPKRRLKSGFI